MRCSPERRDDFARGEYRWVAQVVNHVVFADPTNQAARQLQADALEQLGYQAESGPWRSFYLTGAQELRNGTPSLPGIRGAVSVDVMQAMTPTMVLDNCAVKLNGPRAAEHQLVFDVEFIDRGETYQVIVANGTLRHRPAGEPAATSGPHDDRDVHQPDERSSPPSPTRKLRTRSASPGPSNRSPRSFRSSISSTCSSPSSNRERKGPSCRWVTHLRLRRRRQRRIDHPPRDLDGEPDDCLIHADAQPTHRTSRISRSRCSAADQGGLHD